MGTLPPEIIERDKEGVEQLRYYGVPVSDLDRDELLAALNQASRQARSSFENFKQYREFEVELRKQEQADYFFGSMPFTAELSADAKR